MKVRALKHSDHWSTPEYFKKKLDEEFGFDYDPCPLNYTVDALELQDWPGFRIFINPPYSRALKEAFVKKAIEESKKGKLCVMLLPVSTSTALFHVHIQPNATEIRFIRGRIKFEGYNTYGNFVTDKTPMHDSMLVVFDGRK